MQETPITPVPSSSPIQSKRSPRKLIIAVAFSVALVVSVGAGLLVRHYRTNTVPLSQQSLTLYYSDGKTVLWKSNDPSASDAPAFAAYVRQKLPSIIGDDYQKKGAWQVTTTLDKSLQTAALQHVKGSASKITSAGAQNAAFIAEDVTTGNVVSYVNGLDGTSSNDILYKRTPVGFLGLPLTYAAYLDQTAKSTDTVVNDTQGPLPDYPCTNLARPNLGGNCAFDYDQRYLGPITLYQAIAKARQVPAIHAANSIGIQTTLDTVAKMGSDNKCYADEALTKEATCYSASAIGDGVFARPQEILQAYATLAHDGSRLAQTTVLAATLNGKPQAIPKPAAPLQAVRQSTAKSVVAALSDTSASILHADAALFTTAKGVKTALVDGVTYSGNVASSIQFSQKYAVGFWMSREGSPLSGTLESTTLPLTAAWMNDAE